MNGEVILHCPWCGEVMLPAEGYWECPRCGGEFWQPEDETPIEREIRECFIEDMRRGARGRGGDSHKRKHRPIPKKPAEKYTLA